MEITQFINVATINDRYKRVKSNAENAITLANVFRMRGKGVTRLSLNDPGVRRKQVPKDISEGHSTVQNLIDAKNNIDAMLGSLIHDLRNIKSAKSIVKDLQSLKKTVEEEIQKTHQDISDKSLEIAPQEWKRTVNSVVKTLQSKLGSKFDSIDTSMSVGNVDGAKHYVSYIEIKGLKDSSGKQIPSYMVVLTLAVTGAISTEKDAPSKYKDHKYVTTMPSSESGINDTKSVMNNTFKR
jgi:hypothetical protein